MGIFALGDLHLSHASSKPMDVFGPNWAGHEQRIQAAWTAMVTPQDIVLVPGDISWAMHMAEAAPDLTFIASLPGRKVLLRGNHDYWWSSLSKVRSLLQPDMFALQNDCICLDGWAIVGTRGWVCPGSALFDPSRDQKLYDRECIRLELSLQAAPPSLNRICMLHYPPFNEKRQPSGFTELLEAYGVRYVVYGHLHGRSCKNAFEGERNGIQYHLCSADHLGFAPKRILEG